MGILAHTAPTASSKYLQYDTIFAHRELMVIVVIYHTCISTDAGSINGISLLIIKVFGGGLAARYKESSFTRYQSQNYISR